jgi:ABC-type uncharacterized transport system involved in gliding motility auxiliary subunit
MGLISFLLFFYAYFPDIREFVTKRSTRYAVNTAIMTLIFVVIITVTGIMSVKYKLRVDLTEDRRYSLSSQTVKILKSLNSDVEAIAFYRSDERTRQAMFDLLQEYSYYSSRFSFRFVDPDKNPAQAVRHGITSYRTTLIRLGDKQEVVGTESESKLSSALIKLLSQDVKVIYFVRGHGEKQVGSAKSNGYNLAREAIEKENHEVHELLLMSADKVPEDAAALVVSGPENDLLPGELEKITAYVNSGGRVLFMLDPGAVPGLSEYLRRFGFEVGDDIIVDKLSQVYGANYLTPVVVEYSDQHILTHEFDVATFYPAARSIQIAEEPDKGKYNLAKTSVNSWAVSGELNDENLEFDPSKHRRGPINVVAVAAVEINAGGEEPGGSRESLKKWGKVLVTGDSDFASNTHIKLAGNKDFFLNMLNWLAEESVLISIRKKEPGLTPVMLTARQGKLVFWLSVVIVPSLVLLVGIGVTTNRRLRT